MFLKEFNYVSTHPYHETLFACNSIHGMKFATSYFRSSDLLALMLLLSLSLNKPPIIMYTEQLGNGANSNNQCNTLNT